MTRNSTCGVIALAALTVAPSVASADLNYTFDTDAQGWTTFNDARNFAWNADINGQSGVQATDIGTGQYWFFSAPVADLGDLSGLYGNAVAWDVIGLAGSQSVTNRADIMIQGAGMFIGVNGPAEPENGAWTSWSVDVDVAANWAVANSSSGSLGAAVTEAQMRAVLADVQGFYIRGEYTSGGDSAGIDNVHIVPAPAGVALFGVGALGLVRRKR